MNFPHPNKQTFTKESLKKQFRLSEFLAEKVISSVAFLSIAIIFLIFIFVFKESLPLFGFNDKAKEKTEVQTTTGAAVETYGSETSTEKNQPETYGAPAESLEPETYGTPTEDLNPVVEETAAAEPETYGTVTEDLNPDSASQAEVVVDEKVMETTKEPIKLGVLFLPRNGFLFPIIRDLE
jgi:phosphate transport system permease protein